MSIEVFFTVFVSVFVAEVGDKTQLATLLFAANNKGQTVTVFLAAAVALVTSAALAVLLGGQLQRFIEPRTLKVVAGVLFIVIGIWTVATARA